MEKTVWRQVIEKEWMCGSLLEGLTNWLVRKFDYVVLITGDTDHEMLVILRD